MTVNPDVLDDPEPSAGAIRHADRNKVLWDRARDLLGPLRTIFKELEDNDAAPPMLMDRNRPCGVYPDEFLGLIESMFASDYSHCEADDRERYDRALESNDRERVAEGAMGK